MAPKYTASFTRLLNLPNVPFSPPPLPALHGVDLVCQRPLEVGVKKSDISRQISIKITTFDRSTLGPFLTEYADLNIMPFQGLQVNAVGLHGNLVVLTLHQDDLFYNFTCEDDSWETFCQLNEIQEGDKVGVWLFTRHTIFRPYMAVLVTQKRVFRRTPIILGN